MLVPSKLGTRWWTMHWGGVWPNLAGCWQQFCLLLELMMHTTLLASTVHCMADCPLSCVARIWRCAAALLVWSLTWSAQQQSVRLHIWPSAMTGSSFPMQSSSSISQKCGWLLHKSSQHHQGVVTTHSENTDSFLRIDSSAMPRRLHSTIDPHQQLFHCCSAPHM